MTYQVATNVINFPLNVEVLVLQVDGRAGSCSGKTAVEERKTMEIAIERALPKHECEAAQKQISIFMYK